MKNKHCLILFLLFVSAYSADYFPMKIGYSWNYQVQQDFIESNGNNVILTILTNKTILKDTIIGTDTIIISIQIRKTIYGTDSAKIPPDSMYYYYINKGNDVLFNFILLPTSAYHKIMEHHPTRDTWLDSMLYVNYYGSAFVSSATFDSCYAINSYKFDDLYIYAPNIGLVETKPPGTWLTDYNFKNTQTKFKPFFKTPARSIGTKKIGYFNVKGQRLFHQQIKLKNPNLLIKQGEIAVKSLNERLH